MWQVVLTEPELDALVRRLSGGSTAEKSFLPTMLGRSSMFISALWCFQSALVAATANLCETEDAGYALRVYILTPFAHNERDNPVKTSSTSRTQELVWPSR